MDPYTAYYLRQAKTGKGCAYINTQKGHGIGTFLSSVFSTVYPYIKKGVSALADEFLSGGIGFLSDVVQQKPSRESFKSRVNTFGTNLTARAANQVDSMRGSGVHKRKRRLVTAHSPSKRRRIKTRGKARKKKRKRVKRKKPVKRLKKLRKSKKRKTARKKPIRRKKSKKTTKKFTDIFS